MTTTRSAFSHLASNSGREFLSCTLLLLVLGFPALCATPVQAPSVSKPTETSKTAGHMPSTAASEPQAKPSDEVIALRAQLELMHQYDQRLLHTVYWSLAVVVTLVIALITIIGLFNLRVYEHDKAALRQDVTGFLNQELAKSQQTFRQEMAAFQQEIQKALGESRNSIAEVSREAAESLVVRLREQLVALDRAVSGMRFDLVEMQAKDWKTRGVYANALAMNLKMLDIARKLDHDFLIAATLEDMQFSLKAIVATKSKCVRADDAKSITEALDGLPNTYAIETGIIRGLLQEARS